MRRIIRARSVPWAAAVIAATTLAWTFPGDQKITQLWNGSYTQSGEAVRVTNASYNAAIAPGGSVTVGFTGTFTSNDTSPSAFTLNGASCS